MRDKRIDELIGQLIENGYEGFKPSRKIVREFLNTEIRDYIIDVTKNTHEIGINEHGEHAKFCDYLNKYLKP